MAAQRAQPDGAWGSSEKKNNISRIISKKQNKTKKYPPKNPQSKIKTQSQMLMMYFCKLGVSFLEKT